MDQKVKTVQELLPLIAVLRAAGKKIVFTNGCFDLLHTGHTRYLAKARSLGDLLVVAVNTDDSVRAIKGPTRPLNPVAARMEVLAALACVDYVTSFSEPDPLRIITQIQPDVLVKGGDWPVEKIVGRDVVEARGGNVVSTGYIEGASTTSLIELIRKRFA